MSSKSGSMWSHPAGKIFLAVCLWNTVAYGLLFNSFSLFVTPIASTHNFKIAAVSLIGTILAILGGVFLNFTGRLTGKVSSKTWFTTVAVGLVLVYFLFSKSTLLWHFYVIGVFYGILAGLGIFITAPVVIPSWFAYSATYLGIAAGCGGLGGMIGAPIISYFIKSGGYPAGFMFSAVVAAVVLIPLGLFVMRFKPEEIGAKPYDIERFQREQAAIAEKAAAAGGTGAVFNGYSEAEVRKMPHWWLLWVFVALLPFLNGVFMHVPGALGDKGLDVILVGTVLSFYQFGVAGGQFIIGWFSEKLGVNATLYLWAAIAVVTAGGLAAYNQPVVAVLASLVFLLGLIRALTTVGLPIIVKTLFGMKDYSKIFSSYYTVVMWAGAIYITVQGWLRDTTGSYNTVFMIISGIAVVLLILLFIIMSMGKAQEQKRLSGEWKPMQ